MAALNIVGNINEDLESINVNMRRIKLPHKVVGFVPQWCTRGGLDPKFATRKQEVFILTVILSIITYSYAVIMIVLSIVLFFVIEDIFYMVFAPFVLIVPLFGIGLYYYFIKEKKEKKNLMQLKRNFEIADNKDKVDNDKELHD